MDQKKTKVCKYCKTEIPPDAKVCPQCRKKQGGKGKWIVLAVVVIVVLLAAIGSSGDDAPSASESAPVVTDAPTPETEQTADTAVPTGTPVPTATPEPETTSYESGMYLVGQDMPAGEYVLFSDGIAGYMEVCTDSSGNFDSILCNENFDYNTIVTVSDGQYFSFQRSHAVPIEEAEVDTSGEGMFKIGLHLPAGEYRVALDDNNSVGMGYIEVSTDSSHLFDSIRTNDNIEGASYITVNEGEYLTLNGCHIEQ